MQYVHYNCFSYWILVSPEDKKDTCSICNHRYTVKPFTNLEVVPEKQPIFLFLLSNPITSIIILNYSFIEYVKSYSQITIDQLIQMYVINQGAYQILWIVIFLSSLRIKNKYLYIYLMIKSYRIYYAIEHVCGIILFLYLPGAFYLMGPIISTFFQFYWEQHTKLLEEINETLLNPRLAS
jgi:hypothetical protein